MTSDLRALLSQSKRAGKAVRFEMVTGEELTIRLGAVGVGWFSGDRVIGEPHGVVIPFRSVTGIWESGVESSSPLSIPSPVAMRVMLRSLHNLAKDLRVITGTRVWCGKVTAVKSDVFQLLLVSGQRLWVPEHAVVWIAVV